MVISGWRAALVLVVGLVIVGLLLTAVFWIGILLAALTAVGWFSLFLLPRVAQRLRLPQLVVAIAVLPLLAIAGFALGGVTGVVAGCSIWAIAVALPRVLLRRLRGRLWQQPSADMMPTQVRVIDARFRTQDRGLPE